MRVRVRIRMKMKIKLNDNQNDDENHEIRQISWCFKMINELKSFEEQINLLKKINYLDDFWYMSYDDNKELNLKTFELKFAYILNDIDENLFEEVFGHTFVTLADKLINTTKKEENQIIINDIKKNRDKLYDRDEFHNIQRNKRIDLIDAFRVISEFNKAIQSDLV